MDQKSIKVLVVDDEDDITHFTSKILEKEGFSTFKALDGAKAIEIFEKERPQISIIDVDLGYSKIDGIEVLEKIKEIDSMAEGIMITRITEKKIKSRAKELGVTRYLNKPLDWQVWLKEVCEVADIIKKRN